MKKILLLALSLSFAFSAQASYQRASSIYHSGDKSQYPQLVSELIDEKLYFSAVPFLKEYLSTSGKINDAALDRDLDRLVSEVGVRQFEILPVNILEKSNAPTLRYILAKKAFRQGKYEEALKHLEKRIDDSNSVKPFSLLLKGSILSATSKGDAAISIFKECIDVSNSHLRNTKNPERIWQLKINRDYCLVGIARTEFAMKKYESANLSYLDLDKSSSIWPEILFEEAWNSFYLKDFNRTLGKLVTYKAPVFHYIFNPEIEVLKALTFMELCLWDDSKNVVEKFYTKYEADNDNFTKVLNSMGKDYSKYYMLMKDHAEGTNKSGGILGTALSSIAKDSAYRELISSYNDAHVEIEKLKSLAGSKFKAELEANLKDALALQRDLIGGYVKGQLQLSSAQMIKAFEDMSYIKLEILSKRKTEIYDQVSLRGERARGDVMYVKRTDKQYFWNFKGEFWADELGDYVFALRSECK
jgi:tetratricopeptide (TPR) repeat protein